MIGPRVGDPGCHPRTGSIQPTPPGMSVSDIDVSAGESSDDRPPDRGPRPAPRSRPTADHLFAASVVAAIAPIVVAVVRASRAGWLPVGDNGFFAVRARDVLTEHHPLLGTWTSASLKSGTNFNNPGPLLFDLLAVPAKLFRGGIGVAIGAAVLNVLAVIGIGLVARRRGGPVIGSAAVLTASVLGWTMGSELLFDPWQPHSLLLTFLFLLVLVWSLVCGDVAMLPWVVGVGSLVLQTHLSYTILLGALSTWGLLGGALTLRRQRVEDPASWPGRRRSAARAALVAVAVAVLCWAQPVVEQISAGEGNLTRLARNTSTPDRIGVGMGTRVVADTLTVPPFWFRPSFEEADASQTVSPSVAGAVALLVAFAALVCVAMWHARRRRDRVASAALSTTLVAVAAALVTAASLPGTAPFVATHHIRWLWIIAAFSTFAAVVYGLRLTDIRRRVTPLTGALAVAAGLVALANLPAYNPRLGPNAADAATYGRVQRLDRQLAALRGKGPLLLELDGDPFGSPYGGAVMAALQRRDIEFVVDEEDLVRQLGPSRRLDPERRPPRLLVRSGAPGDGPPPQARRVAFVEGLTDREQRELDDLQRTLAAFIKGGGVTVSERGEELIRAGTFADLADRLEEHLARPVDFEQIDSLIEVSVLEVDPEGRTRIRRAADLQARRKNDTVAVYIAPFDASR